MGGPGNRLQPPSSGVGASDKISSIKAACCKCDDYQKEIDVDASTRYWTRRDGSGKVVREPHKAKYQLLVPLKSGAKITAKLRLRIERTSGVTDADLAQVKTRLKGGLDWMWNGALLLSIDDPECGTAMYPIEYVHAWVSSGEHYVVRRYPDEYMKAGLRGNVVKVGPYTGDGVYAHELAHCYGLPDEYTRKEWGPLTLSYYTPDGTPDAPFSLPMYEYHAQKWSDPSIMQTGEIVYPRHGWNIAIEVRDLLTEKLGRKIRCTVQKGVGF
jgi:type VI secretion system secreted protein VgrG